MCENALSNAALVSNMPPAHAIASEIDIDRAANFGTRENAFVEGEGHRGRLSRAPERRSPNNHEYTHESVHARHVWSYAEFEARFNIEPTNCLSPPDPN
jgi:hypothetical protein